MQWGRCFVAFDTHSSIALGGVFNFQVPLPCQIEKEKRDSAAQTAAACKGAKVKTMAIYWPISSTFSCLIRKEDVVRMRLCDVYVFDSLLALFHAASWWMAYYWPVIKAHDKNHAFLLLFYTRRAEREHFKRCEFYCTINIKLSGGGGRRLRVRSFAAGF